MGDSYAMPSRVEGLGRRTTIPSAIVSVYATSIILLGFIFSSERFLHWFIVPVGLCGIIIGIDAVNWLRGRVSLFSPIGIIGALGYHFFFLAPLLHVYWDTWMRYITPPSDWRPWLGGMAALNFIGILIYRWARRWAWHKQIQVQKSARVWIINKPIFVSTLLVALMFSAVLQTLVYIQFGGIEGYISAYENYEWDRFVGMGYIFSLSEIFPILLAILYAFYARKRNWKSWTSIAIFLLLFLLISLLFGGLRGSRSATIWKLFWAVGIIHFWVRPVSKRMVVLGLVFLLGFMYVYGLYKGGGRDAIVQLLDDPQRRVVLESQTGRTFETMLLGDLGRSDVQAFLLYRLTSPYSDYQYAWGRTYLAGAVTWIPRVIWPDRPPAKVKEGTEALYGAGSYDPVNRAASNVYGLAGEAMLNFGILGIPFAFALFGYIVGRMERFIATLSPDDARWFLVPFLVNLCFNILHSDSDNIVFFLVSNGLLPFLVIFISRKVVDHSVQVDSGHVPIRMR